MFQRESRRWSRVDDIVNTVIQPSLNEHHQTKQGNQSQQNNQNQQQDCSCQFSGNMPLSAVPIVDPSEELSSRFRRSGSERLRDGAKAILRRVESLKTRRRKQRNRDGIVIGSPQVR